MNKKLEEAICVTIALIMAGSGIAIHCYKYYAEKKETHITHNQPNIDNKKITSESPPQKSKGELEEQQKEIEKLKAHPIIAPF